MTSTELQRTTAELFRMCADASRFSVRTGPPKTNPVGERAAAVVDCVDFYTPTGYHFRTATTGRLVDGPRWTDRTKRKAIARVKLDVNEKVISVSTCNLHPARGYATHPEFQKLRNRHTAALRALLEPPA